MSKLIIARRKLTYCVVVLVAIALLAEFVLASTINTVSTTSQNGYSGSVINVPGIGTVSGVVSFGTQNSVVQQVFSGNLGAVVYDSTDGVLVLWNTSANTLIGVNAQTGATKYVSGMAPLVVAGMAWDSTTDQVFVVATNSSAGVFGVFSANKGSWTSTISESTTHTGPVVYDAFGTDFFVESGESTVYVYSNAGSLTNTITETSTASGCNPSMVYNPFYQKVFLLYPSSLSAPSCLYLFASMTPSGSGGTFGGGAIAGNLANDYVLGADPVTGDMCAGITSLLAMITGGATVATSSAVAASFLGCAFDTFTDVLYVTFGNTEAVEYTYPTPTTLATVSTPGLTSPTFPTFTTPGGNVFVGAQANGPLDIISARYAGVYEPTTDTLLGSGGIISVCATGSGCAAGDPQEIVTIPYTVQSPSSQTFTVQVIVYGSSQDWSSQVETFLDPGTGSGSNTILVVVDLGPPNGQSVSSIAVIANT